MTLLFNNIFIVPINMLFVVQLKDFIFWPSADDEPLSNDLVFTCRCSAGLLSLFDYCDLYAYYILFEALLLASFLALKIVAGSTKKHALGAPGVVFCSCKYLTTLVIWQMATPPFASI
jgi:hypothetical protein